MESGAAVDFVLCETQNGEFRSISVTPPEIFTEATQRWNACCLYGQD